MCGKWMESSMNPFMKLNISVYVMENLYWFIKVLASSSEKLYRNLGGKLIRGEFPVGDWRWGESVFSLLGFALLIGVWRNPISFIVEAKQN